MKTFYDNKDMKLVFDEIESFTNEISSLTSFYKEIEYKAGIERIQAVEKQKDILLRFKDKTQIMTYLKALGLGIKKYIELVEKVVDRTDLDTFIIKKSIVEASTKERLKEIYLFLDSVKLGSNNSKIKDIDYLLQTTETRLKYGILEQSEEPHHDGKEQHSQFSVTEWTTIFYYAESVKALEGKTMTKKIESFMNQYGISKTQTNFRNTFYEARKRINKNLDYPINKLELILPFIKEHYPHAKKLLQNDIEHLETEQEMKRNES